MRLLFVSRAYYPATRYGGPVTSLHRLCTMLAHAGHEVKVVCTNMASPGRKGDRLPPGHRQVDGVDVTFLPVSLALHWEGVALRGPRVLRKSISKADVVHVAGTRHFLGATAEVLARRMKVPYFVMPEGSVPARSRSVRTKRLVDAIYTRPSLARSFRTIAGSPAEAEDLVAWGVDGARVMVLPPRPGAAVEISRSREELRAERKIDPEAKVLLWIGRIHGEKGLSLLIRALRDPRLEGVTLILAGAAEDVEFERSLRNTVKRATTDDKVIFLGWVEQQQKAELYKLADVFVFPSRKENFGLAAAEAVVSGLPVVVTDGCGIAPMIRDRAGLVCEYAEASLADSIARILHDSRLLARLRGGTADVGKEFGSDSVAIKLVMAYREAKRGDFSNAT